MMTNAMPVLIDQIHVVLVEPSTAQHRIIEGYLRELGVSYVDWVQTGRQALDTLARRKPDLLISIQHQQRFYLSIRGFFIDNTANLC